MVELIKETEAIPTSYPSVTPYPHTNFDVPIEQDAQIEPALIWQRIEAYIAHRWTEREVVWIIAADAGEEWTPRLTPVNSHSAERWDGAAWQAVTLLDGPEGLCMPSGGRYRITASVGAGDPPEAVREAFRRLHEYARGIAESWRTETAQYRSDTSQAVAGWAGKAIQLSGAADLLRNYRRA
jgi:hypothetical protein